jgi:hypothetical protein
VTQSNAASEAASAGGSRPRAWARPDEVAPESHVARQLALIDALISGSLPGPDFARSWLAERRQSMDAGERLRELFERAFDQVFYAIEDYVIDPALREPGDMTDDDLVKRVAAANRSVEQLNR